MSCLFVIDVMETFMLVINNLKSSWHVLVAKQRNSLNFTFHRLLWGTFLGIITILRTIAD